MLSNKMIKGTNIHIGTDMPLACVNSDWIKHKPSPFGSLVATVNAQYFCCACNVSDEPKPKIGLSLLKVLGFQIWEFGSNPSLHNSTNLLENLFLHV